VESGDLAEAEDVTEVEADDAIGDGFPTPAVAEDGQPAHAA
jgi:ParB family chromosome partitioning protein